MLLSSWNFAHVIIIQWSTHNHYSSHNSVLAVFRVFHLEENDLLCIIYLISGISFMNIKSAKYKNVFLIFYAQLTIFYSIGNRKYVIKGAFLESGELFCTLAFLSTESSQLLNFWLTCASDRKNTGNEVIHEMLIWFSREWNYRSITINLNSLHHIILLCFNFICVFWVNSNRKFSKNKKMAWERFFLRLCFTNQ